MRTVRATIGAACMLALGAGIAMADMEPDPPPGGYRDAQVPEVLEKLGYDVRPQPASGGYWVTILRETTTYTTCVSLSGDRTNVWITTFLAEVPEGAAGNMQAMRRLLQENETNGPARFCYNSADKRFELKNSVPNRDMTPARLRKAIEDSDALARKTAPLWRREAFIRLVDIPEKLSTDEFARLQGAWTILEYWEQGARIPDANLKQVKPTASIHAGKIVVMAGDKKETFGLVVDPRGTPSRVDWINADHRPQLGIYKQDGDVLTIVLTGNLDKPRPTTFEVNAENKYSKIVLKRTSQP